MEHTGRGVWQVTACVVLTLGMYLAVAGLLFGHAVNLPVSARIWALSASSCFVLISAAVATRFGQPAAWMTVLGLIACWLGDYLGPIHFQAGALSFLIAHGLFIGAWTLSGPDWPKVARTLCLVLLATVGISIWLVPWVPRADIPLVLAYMAVISLMVGVAGGGRGPLRELTLLGAVLFYVSDIAVARGQYVAPGVLNSWICYPLYYTACLLLAYSAWRKGANESNRQIASDAGSTS